MQNIIGFTPRLNSLDTDQQKSNYIFCSLLWILCYIRCHHCYIFCLYRTRSWFVLRLNSWAVDKPSVTSVPSPFVTTHQGTHQHHKPSSNNTHVFKCLFYKWIYIASLLCLIARKRPFGRESLRGPPRKFQNWSLLNNSCRRLWLRYYRYGVKLPKNQ